MADPVSAEDVAREIASDIQDQVSEYVSEQWILPHLTRWGREEQIRALERVRLSMDGPQDGWACALIDTEIARLRSEGDAPQHGRTVASRCPTCREARLCGYCQDCDPAHFSDGDHVRICGDAGTGKGE